MSVLLISWKKLNICANYALKCAGYGDLLHIIFIIFHSLFTKNSYRFLSIKQVFNIKVILEN